MLNIASEIFRAYDIRGDVRNQLTPQTVLEIGRTLGLSHFPPGSRVAVGRDARTHSPELTKNLVNGLCIQGVHVIDLGMITTPMLYFFLAENPSDGGIMITGSHNPINDNGLKICAHGRPFLKSDIERVYQKTLSTKTPAPIRGSVTPFDIFPAYLNAITSRVQPKQPLSIVIDCGNGAAGPFASQVFSHYASTLHALYCTPDGAFPNHHPDPSVPENMKDCSRAVCQYHADIGLAFDGDGDRLGVIDNDGSRIDADKLIALFSREILSRSPHATILGDVKCSKSTFDDIKKHGGVPVMTQSGHALIKTKMLETNAAFAGEMSGHFFFKDRWFGFDDAIYAAARLCEIIAGNRRPIRDILADIPQTYATPEIRIPCPDEQKFAFTQYVTDTFRNRYPTCDIDGARIDFEQGWVLVRASNTQPVIVMRAESNSESGKNDILNRVASEMMRYAKIHNLHIDWNLLKNP